MTNREFAEQNKEFREACKRAGIPATPRQASKWRAKSGKAWLIGRPPNGEATELKQAS